MRPRTPTKKTASKDADTSRSPLTPHWLELISPSIRPVPTHIPVMACTGYGIHPAGWIEPNRVIYEHLLVLFRTGNFRMEIESKEYECPAGTFIIVPPGTWHITWNTANGAGRRDWCHFDWVYQGNNGDAPLMTYHPRTPKARHVHRAPAFIPSGILRGKIPRPRVTYDLMERLCQMQLIGNPHDQLSGRGVLLELLIQLLNQDMTEVAACRQESWLALQVKERLKTVVENGRELPSIQSVLESFNYSYAHLCRLFQTEYGITPLKYVQLIRITRAKQLMRDMRLNIADISYKVGFNNPHYFSRLFYKFTRQQPKAYRAHLRQNLDTADED